MSSTVSTTTYVTATVFPNGALATDTASYDAYVENEVASNSRSTLLMAHGIILTIVFLFGFPLASIMLHIVPRSKTGMCRIPGLPNVVHLHAMVQVSLLLLAVVGLGMGIAVAYGKAGALITRSMDVHHLIGFVVFIGLLIQPCIGYLHHMQFRRGIKTVQVHEGWTGEEKRRPKPQNPPKATSKLARQIDEAEEDIDDDPSRFQVVNTKRTLHIWFGRIIITLGVLDGVLGLPWSLVGSSPGMRGLFIMYCLAMGIIWAGWAAIVYVTRRRRQSSSNVESFRKIDPPPQRPQRAARAKNGVQVRHSYEVAVAEKRRTILSTPLHPAAELAASTLSRSSSDSSSSSSTAKPNPAASAKKWFTLGRPRADKTPETDLTSLSSGAITLPPPPPPPPSSSPPRRYYNHTNGLASSPPKTYPERPAKRTSTAAAKRMSTAAAGGKRQSLGDKLGLSGGAGRRWYLSSPWKIGGMVIDDLDYGEMDIHKKF